MEDKEHTIHNKYCFRITNFSNCSILDLWGFGGYFLPKIHTRNTDDLDTKYPKILFFSLIPWGIYLL